MEQKELRPEHHAALYGLLAKHCVLKFGEEGKETVLSLTSRYGRERGLRMAARCSARGEERDMYHYLAYTEWRSIPGETRGEVSAYQPEYVTRSFQCPWMDSWEKYGLIEYGRLYCQVVDKSILEGFNPELRLEINSLLSQGGPACEFVWKDSGISGEDDRAGLAEKKKSLEETCVKDFRYHTGHLYQVFKKGLEERFGGAGAEICREALAEYREIFGDACEFPPEGNYGADPVL